VPGGWGARLRQHPPAHQPGEILGGWPAAQVVMVSAAAEKKTEMIGKILAEYRIVEELGGQAGAQVFKAIGYDSRRPVAIKLFPSTLSRDK
jgi:hypothetical protein